MAQRCPAPKQNSAFIKPQEAVVIGSAGQKCCMRMKFSIICTKIENLLFFLSVSSQLRTLKQGNHKQKHETKYGLGENTCK